MMCHARGSLVSLTKKVAVTLIVTFLSVCFLWALFVSARTPKLVRKRKGHGQMMTSVSFSPDGRLLASASYDGTVKLWRVSDGKLLRTLRHDNDVSFVTVSADGYLMASGRQGWEC